MKSAWVDASVLVLAKKMANSETVTRTISVPKTKIIKQPIPTPSKSETNDAIGTAIKPITHQKPSPS